MKNRVKNDLPQLAVIGLGKQGQKHLVAALSLQSQGKLKLVASCDPALSYSAAAYHYTEAGQLFSSHQLDVVIISTPNKYHQQLTEVALSHGISVLKEKPLALSLEEADDLVAKTDSGQERLVVCQQRLFKPVWQELKKVLAVMGQLRSFSYTFMVNDDKKSWYWDSLLAGGGVWLNMGWHPMRMINWLWGEIESCEVTSNRGGARPWPYSTDHSSYCRVKMRSGVVGSILVSCVHPAKEVFRVETTRGVVTLANEELSLVHEGGREVITVPQEVDPYQVQLEHFLADRSLFPTIESDREVLAALLMAVEVSRAEGASYVTSSS